MKFLLICKLERQHTRNIWVSILTPGSTANFKRTFSTWKKSYKKGNEFKKFVEITSEPRRKKDNVVGGKEKVTCEQVKKSKTRGIIRKSTWPNDCKRANEATSLPRSYHRPPPTPPFDPRSWGRGERGTGNEVGQRKRRKRIDQKSYLVLSFPYPSQYVICLSNQRNWRSTKVWYSSIELSQCRCSPQSKWSLSAVHSEHSTQSRHFRLLVARTWPVFHFYPRQALPCWIQNKETC